MYHKSSAVQEAEAIIIRYIRRQSELSRQFQVKSRRKLPWGVFLLLGSVLVAFFLMAVASVFY